MQGFSKLFGGFSGARISICWPGAQVLEMFIGLYRLGLGAGNEELLSRIYQGFLRYFVHSLQGVSSKVSKGFPGTKFEGFHRVWSRIYKVLQLEFPKGLSRMSEANRVFIQSLGFPRCFFELIRYLRLEGVGKKAKFMLSRVQMRNCEELMRHFFFRLERGEEGDKRGLGARCNNN